MDHEQLLKKVKEQMTEHRYVHTLGVAKTARALAEAFGEDGAEAELAGILHDYCKFWEKERMRGIIQKVDSIPWDLLDFDKELWHAPVGAHVVETELKITNPKILSAIRYHTSGRAGMSQMEKILWLADYIEPSRNFPGVEEVREMAEIDLDQALIKAFGNTITFLVKQGKRIYPVTLEAYNDLVHQYQLRKG